MSAPLYIVIPTHGRPDLLGRTLASIAACPKPATYCGTWVIENGSAAGAEQVVEEFATPLQAQYRHIEEPGKANALNLAVRELDPDALLVMFDDDVRLEPDVLTAYHEAAEKEPHSVFFGGPTRGEFEVQPPPWRMSYLPIGVRGWSGEREGRMSNPHFLGYNWAAYAGDLQKIGGFNTQFGPGSASDATGDESDAKRRLQQIGVTGYYVPKALVWHFIPEIRSSEDWTIDRARRHGIDTGLSVPSNILRRCNGRFKKAAWGQLLKMKSILPPRLTFHARFRQSAWTGFLAGQDLQRQSGSSGRTHHEQQPAPPTASK